MLLYNRVTWLLFIWILKSINCQSLFNDLLYSTQQLVNYYKEQFGNMNLDGIYGLRVLEGQTLLILQNAPNLDKSVHSILTNIYQDAHNISEKSLSFIRQDDEEYFSKLHPLVAKPLLIAESYRRIDPKLKWPSRPPGNQKQISEIKSDQCITSLFGSQSKPKCYMPEDCLDIFTEPGYSDYSLTHQILYSLVVQQHGCTARYESYLQTKGYKGGMAQLRLEFCTNVFYDAASLVQKVNKLLPFTQDLFMEQVFTCAVMGFMEFVHVDWLRQLISWQKPSGCFGEMPRQKAAKLQPKDMDYQYADDKPEENAKPFNSKGSSLPQVNIGHNAPMENEHKVPSIGNDHNAQPIGDSPNMQHVQSVGSTIQHIVSDPNVQHVDIVVPDAINKAPVADWWQLNQDKLQDNNIVNNWDHPQVEMDIAKKDDLKWEPHKKQQQQQQLQEPHLINQPFDKLQQQDNFHLSQQQNDNQMFAVPPQQQHQVKLGHIAELSHTVADRKQAEPQQPVIQEAIIQQNVGNRNVLFVHKELSNYTRDAMARDTWQHQDNHLAVRRRLLVEKSLEGNCLAHKTAVAAGMLSQYLRFYLDPGSPEYHAAVQVEGVNHMLLPIPDDDYDDKSDISDDAGGGIRQQGANGKMEVRHQDDGNHRDKNYPGDNEDKPQAYYNDEDDDHNDGDDNLANNKNVQVPKQNLEQDEKILYANHVGRVNGFGAKDKLDMDEKRKDALTDHMEMERMNPKHQPIINQHEKGQEGNGNNYPYYYDEKDDRKKEGQPNHQVQITEAGPPNVIVARSVSYNRKVDNGVSVGTSYAVILLIMAVLLYYMTKFVRRRRILIKYR